MLPNAAVLCGWLVGKREGGILAWSSHAEFGYQFSIYFVTNLLTYISLIISFHLPITRFWLWCSCVCRQYAWFWLLWFLSYTWIVLHIWTPKSGRLASTDQMFVTPMYNTILIDQSLALNRRRDGEAEIKTKDVDNLQQTDEASWHFSYLSPSV